jgi:hypothetical protein
MPRPKPMCFSFPFRPRAWSASRVPNTFTVRYTLAASPGFTSEEAFRGAQLECRRFRKKPRRESAGAFFDVRALTR